MREQLLENADSIEILILGNSHTTAGINPHLFTLYAQSMAFGSQSLYFDRRITEKYLPILPNLKYVFISFDYFSLYSEHEESRDFFYKYYYDIDYKNRKFGKEYFLQSFFVYSPKKTLELMWQQLFPPEGESAVQKGKGWHGWNGHDYEQVASVDWCRGKAAIFNKTIDSYEGGDAIFQDLESLIITLKSRGITPILITCPNYSTLRSFFRKEILDENKRKADYLVHKHGVLLLDYFEDDSFTYLDYADCDHLNLSGAEKLTTRIDSLIMEMESSRLYNTRE